MARKRAVILEMDGRVARVLASGGEFRTIRAPKGLGIGDEIDLASAMPVYNWRPQLALVATLAIMLVFSSAGISTLASSFNRVAAYVTVDINPSVELGVNRWGWVISARGLNNEGAGLLDVTEYRAFKLADIVPELTRLATDRGYIAEGKPNTVIVAAAPAGSGTTPDTVAREVALAKQQTAAAAGGSASPPITVTTIVTPDTTLRADAEAMNLSLGKLAVVLEARNSGVPVRVSDVERDGLAKAIEAAGGKFHDVVVKAQDEGNFAALASQFADQLKREKDDDNKGNGRGKNSGGSSTTPGEGSGPDSGTSSSGNSSSNGGVAQGGSSGNGAGGKGDADHSNSGNSQGNANNRGNGNGVGKGKDPGKFADRIRDGFRELGERIKHKMGKGK